jgi:hypothetical protein
MKSQRVQIIPELRSLCAAVLALLCAGGCVSQRGQAPGQAVPATASDLPAFAATQRTLSEVFPPAYQATQRAIITIGRRQFVCDGFLTVSPAEGAHLALISTLGLVTDVRAKSNGSLEVQKVTPLFREDWAREYVARELGWLFTSPPDLAPAGRLSDGRLLVEAKGRADALEARYVCSADGSRWEELEVRRGSQSLFHAKVSAYRSFPGLARPVPAEIEVDAVNHHLDLRIVAIKAASVAPGKEAQ